jgi:hypothetical protein
MSPGGAPGTGGPSDAKLDGGERRVLAISVHGARQNLSDGVADLNASGITPLCASG